MINSKTISAICISLALTACETKEDATKRLTQFNGKTLAQVTDVIGKPTIENKTTAVWYHESTHTEYQPYYSPYIYGHRHHYGYRHSYTYRLKCTYTAKLKKGRVLSGIYKGNSCLRFAPKPSKKRNA